MLIDWHVKQVEPMYILLLDDNKRHKLMTTTTRYTAIFDFIH